MTTLPSAYAREGCQRAVFARSLCDPHYQSDRRARLRAERRQAPEWIHGRKSVVYALFDIREPDLVRYVGMTTGTAKRRRSHHWGDAKRGSQSAVHLWMLDIGRENVGVRILEDMPDVAMLLYVEQQWVQRFMPQGALLNATPTGYTPKYI